jgi:DNA-binding response OmpR family regulator
VSRLVVLVVDECLREAEATKRTLELAGHRVETGVLGDAKLAASLDAGSWDAVVTEWSSRLQPGTKELIAALEKRRERPWVIVATNKPVAATVDAAFTAGADDYVHKPFVKEELLARLAGRSRALARAEGSHPTRTTRFRHLECWKDFERTAVRCVEDMMGREVERSKPSADFAPAHATSLILSVPHEEVEFRLMIEVEAAALEAMGEALFGGASSSAVLLDILNETANTVGGSFMRAALAENVEMTTSLPSALSLEDIPDLLARSETRTTLCLADPAGGRMTIHLTIRERGNFFVPVARLREGMVLARDLLTPAGALLLKRGTRMTSSAAQRVGAILGNDVTVEVAESAS